MNKKQANKIQKLLSEIDIELFTDDLIEAELNSFEELNDYLRENGLLDVEVIYCYKALKYLLKNDPSLQLSCGIAFDLGYTVEQINSELLASLLSSQELENDFWELQNEIEEILNI